MSDRIVSKPSTPEFREGWDRAFGERKMDEGRMEQWKGASKKKTWGKSVWLKGAGTE